MLFILMVLISIDFKCRVDFLKVCEKNLFNSLYKIFFLRIDFFFYRFFIFWGVLDFVWLVYFLFLWEFVFERFIWGFRGIIGRGCFFGDFLVFLWYRVFFFRVYRRFGGFFVVDWDEFFCGMSVYYLYFGFRVFG